MELVDEDEFEVHHVELRYPEDLVAAARAARATRVFRQASLGEPPFIMESALPWLDEVARLHSKR